MCTNRYNQNDNNYIADDSITLKGIISMEKETKPKSKILIISIIVIAVVLAVLAICLLIHRQKNKMDDSMAAVYQVQLIVVSPNNNQINCVRYPYYYMRFTDDNAMIDLDLEYDTMHYIPKEDYDFFRDFIEKNDNTDERTEDSVLTYTFRVTGYTDLSCSDIDTSMVAYGYDTFPVELNEVIDRLNRLCSEDLMEYPTDKIEDIPSFIYQELGVSEDDYPREDIEKMLEDNGPLAMDKMFSSSGGFAGMMNGYYSSITAGKVEKYLPYEVKDATEISDEDYTELVNKYVEKLGDGWDVMNGIYPDGLTMICKDGHPTNGYMYIGKADLVKKWQEGGDLECREGEALSYLMPAGEEGMSKRSDFIYNEDASLVLVDYNCSGPDYDEYVEIFYNLK